MAQIRRYLEEKILENLKNRKILIIYGARQVGKTTLVKKFLKEFPENIYLNGDFLDDAEKLSEPTRDMVKQFEGKNLLIIDEAQKIENENIYGFEFKRKDRILDKKIKEIYKQDLGDKGDLEAICSDNFNNFVV